MSWTVGLTGGIASGKTAVADLLIASGVPVLDADQAARDVVEPGTPALDAIIKHFGQDILTAEGALDRAALRTRVFHQPADRKVLESIVHPAVRTAMNDWRARQSAAYCVLAIPLLVESGLQAMVDRVLLVDTPPALQRQRLMQRDDIDGPLADRMIQAQANRDTRLAVADDVIDNSGPYEALAPQVHALHQRYLELAGGKPMTAPQ